MTRVSLSAASLGRTCGGLALISSLIWDYYFSLAAESELGMSARKESEAEKQPEMEREEKIVTVTLINKSQLYPHKRKRSYTDLKTSSPREPVPARCGQRGGPAAPRHPNPPLQSPSARSSRAVVRVVTYVGFVLNSIGLLSERLQFHYHSRRGG